MTEPIKIDFIGGTPGPKGRFPVNMRYRPVGVHGKPELYGSPGHTHRVTPKYGKGRFIHSNDNYCYVVIGKTFYRINTNWSASEVGTLSTNSGLLGWDSSETQLMLTDNENNGYIYTYAANTLEKITDEDFPGAEDVAFCKGFFLYPRPGTNQVHNSALRDGLSNEGQYVILEARQDNTIAIARLGENVWCFGERSIEPLTFVNAPNQPFGLQHATIDIGIGAPKSLASGNDELFWLNQYGEVCRSHGLGYIIVSPEELTNQIQGYSDYSDAIGYFYTQGGHGYYVITFPSANRTFCHDVSIEIAQSWSQWSSGTSDGRHRANCHTFWHEKRANVILDFENGKVSTLELDTRTDAGATILRERMPPIMDAEGRMIRYDELEIIGKRGIGDNTTTDPQMMIDWSDDLYGDVFSNEITVSAGAIGERNWRSRLHGLGMSDYRAFRWRASDPVEWTIIGAILKAKAMRF